MDQIEGTPALNLEMRGAPAPDRTPASEIVVVMMLAMLGAFFLFGCFAWNAEEGDYDGTITLVVTSGWISALYLLGMTSVALARQARIAILLLCMSGYFVGEAVWVSWYVGGGQQLGAPDLGVATPPAHALIFIAIEVAISGLLMVAAFAPHGRRVPAMLRLHGFVMSPERDAWWDGSAWHDAAREIPAGATRDATHDQWWDGAAWRNAPTHSAATSAQVRDVR